jgi:hypothetical protein
MTLVGPADGFSRARLLETGDGCAALTVRLIRIEPALNLSSSPREGSVHTLRVPHKLVRESYSLPIESQSSFQPAP